ncbi:MAG: aminotransferase class I/II-fold pyridoxal phosphate-dependent enzyme, partial [Acidimicrobiia bacterium]|nr:aminotransferase class I/II-fold pyridoxal phosphate-dependent enzyme [Acidimicrobiia bacterium]
MPAPPTAPTRVGPQGGDPRARGASVRVDLSTCVCRYGPPPPALAAARGVSAEALRAHPYGAVDQLLEAYGRYLGVPAGDLVAGRGVSELVWQLAAGPLGERVVVPVPAYTEFRQAFPGAAVGAPGVHHPLGVIAEALGSGAVVLVANPHNPSGRAFGAQELAAVAAAHPQGVLVVDESYVEFCADPATFSLVGAHLANLVVLRSPSKFFGLAGCRVGVAWSPVPALRRGVDRPRGSWPVSALEVAPAAAALADTAWASATRAQLVEDGAWLDRQVGPL